MFYRFLIFFIICLAVGSARAESVPHQNPMFGEFENAFRMDGFYAIDGWADRIATLMFTYSQPNSFFRLPGRRGLHVLRITGDTKGAKDMSMRREYNVQTGSRIAQWAVGLSQEVVFWSPGNFYFGAGIGPFVKEQKNDFLGSEWMAGERVFVGYSFGQFHAELAAQHFSDGHLNQLNNGMNSVGIAVGMSF
ncbi:MAG: acyloxyacyl hydrolase [Alphaproteobacteria bacterium]|nr:acyloxyacyl hydrolase [Alphaproteobacteria bacterium]